MMKIRDWYEMSLLGEKDLLVFGCPERLAEIIEKFKDYEESNLNEYEIRNKAGIPLYYTRKFRQIYSDSQLHPLKIKVDGRTLRTVRPKKPKNENKYHWMFAEYQITKSSVLEVKQTCERLKQLAVINRR